MTTLKSEPSFQEQLYLNEVPVLVGIQKTFVDCSEIFQSVSRIGDPALAFIIYFPVVFGLNARAGVRYLGAVIFCEWMNLVLKWLLHGERPYWWTHVASLPVHLSQTPITCETGPGNPSGHVMMSIVIWLTIYDVIMKLSGNSLEAKAGTPLSASKLMMGRLIWNGVVLKILLTVLSRIFIAAHFVHQCVLALFFGFFAFRYAYQKIKWTDYPISLLVLMMLALPGSALIIYRNLEALLGFSPDWSIGSATKFCNQKNWINLDTLPFYAMIRFSGAAAGLVFSIFISRCLKMQPSRNFSHFQRVVMVLAGIFVGQLSTFIHKELPRTDLRLYYTSEYILNSFFVTVVIIVLPACVRIFSKNSQMDTKKKNAL